jgi:hypothetical protein
MGSLGVGLRVEDDCLRVGALPGLRRGAGFASIRGASGDAESIPG